jgi:hypothetical protein
MMIGGGVAVVLLLCACFGVLGYFASRTANLNEEFAGIFPACDGEPVPQAAAFDGDNVKAIGVQTKAEGTYTATDSMIPSEMRAETLAETAVVLCISPAERTLVESCDYFAEEDQSDLSTIERYQFEQTISMVESQTGKTIARTILQGSSPDDCSDEEFFEDGQVLVVRNGEGVSNADMEAWFADNLGKKK